MAAKFGCAYHSPECRGRVWGRNGSREHLTCAKGRAGYAGTLVAENYEQIQKDRREAGAKKWAKAQKVRAAQARKVAEPVKPVVELTPEMKAALRALLGI